MRHALISSAILMFVSSTAWSQQSLIVDSSGRVGIGTSSPSAAVHVKRTDGTAKILVEEASTNTESVMYELINGGGVRFNFKNIDISRTWSFFLRDDGQLAIGRPDIPGSEWRMTGDGSVYIKGTFNPGSSVSIKKDIEAVDTRDILNKVKSLPVREWSLKSSENGERHMSPMAEDFYSSFGIGVDNKHLSPNDLAGVNMAAIQALAEEVEKRDAEIAALHFQLRELKGQMLGLLNVVDQLSQDLPHSPQIAASYEPM